MDSRWKRYLLNINKFLQDDVRGHHIQFCLNDASVNFYTNEESILMETKAYLQPHMDILPECNSKSWNVIAFHDSTYFQTFADNARDIVITDSGGNPTIGKLTRDNSGNIFILNLRSGNLIIKENALKRISIIGTLEQSLYSGYCSWLSGDAHNVIRQLLRIELENNGALVLHGAAALCGDRGIALVGDKGCGKTTCLISLILKRGAKYVCNDRFFLWVRNNRFYLNGWPTTFRIGLGTLSHFDELHSLIPQEKRKSIFMMPSEMRVSFHGKVVLVPQQISDLFKNQSKKQIELRVLIFPQYEPRGDVFKIARCDYKQARQILLRNIFSPIDKNHPNWLSLERKSKEELNRNCGRVISRLILSTNSYLLTGHGATTELIKCLDNLLLS